MIINDVPDDIDADFHAGALIAIVTHREVLDDFVDRPVRQLDRRSASGGTQGVVRIRRIDTNVFAEREIIGIVGAGRGFGG